MDSSTPSSSVSPFLASAYGPAEPPFCAQEFVRGELVYMFERMAQHLARENVSAEMFVYGGAALAVLYPDIRDICSDIDAFVPHQGYADLTLGDAARTIAKEDIAHFNNGEDLVDLNTLDLEDYIHKGPKDAWSVPLDLGDNNQWLRVRFLEAEGQLLFKMTRRHLGDQDLDDMSGLCVKLGVTSPNDIRAIWQRHKRHFPESKREIAASRIVSSWKGIQERRQYYASIPGYRGPAVQG